MRFKAGVFVLALAGVGLAGCSSMSSERSSDTAFKDRYSGASTPAQNAPTGAAGQTAAGPTAGGAGTEEAQKHEQAFRLLDTNHDGFIDRQEFQALQLE